ncbi:flagellar basal body FlgE domain-containing protein, partial [Aquabacterium sp. A08]|uniref:flagellar basal body FlgE domain-containing protein n=1 Tax=Aquabacterium sp. A08 TaxID=2718532 RepID=UPI002738BAEA
SNGKETKDLRLPTGAPIDPRATTNINITANLDARAEGLGPLTITNPTTSAQADAMPAEAKQYGTAVNVYDAQGNAIPVQLYFVKNEPVTADPTATPPVVGVPANSWEVYASLDGGRTVIPQSPASTNYSLGRLEFDGSGQLTNVPALNLQITATTPGVTADNTPSEPIAAPISFDVDGKSTITQFGGKFGVYDLTQNGYAKGDLTSIDIGE